MDKFNIDVDLTRSTTYILPMLGKKISDFPTDLNCFLGDTNKVELKDKIFLIVKNQSDPWFVANIESLCLKDNFIESYECNNNYTMFVFDVPEEYKSEYFKFKEGKYSLFDDTYKRKVLNFHNLGTHSTVGKVLYRDITLYKEWEKNLGVDIPRTQEIGNMPNPKQEYYNEEEMNTNKRLRLKNEH